MHILEDDQGRPCCARHAGEEGAKYLVPRSCLPQHSIELTAQQMSHVEQWTQRSGGRQGVAGTFQHDRVLSLRPAEVADHAGLAGTGLPAQEHEATLAADRLLQQAIKFL